MCIKCEEQHLTKTCSKTPNQPPKCYNCREEHTTDYRKCAEYAAEAVRAKKARTQSSPFQPQNLPVNISTPIVVCERKNTQPIHTKTKIISEPIKASLIETIIRISLKTQSRWPSLLIVIYEVYYTYQS